MSLGNLLKADRVKAFIALATGGFTFGQYYYDLQKVNELQSERIAMLEQRIERNENVLDDIRSPK